MKIFLKFVDVILCGGGEGGKEGINEQAPGAALHDKLVFRPYGVGSKRVWIFISIITIGINST